MEIGLSLGSNMGDRAAQLSEARDRIDTLTHVAIIAQSSLYETEPVDVDPAYADMPFLNAVLIVETDRTCPDLLDALQSIETDMGRTRTEDQNSPRPVDIDIIYADHDTNAEPHLTIPHPHWSKRRFVVAPLADVRPTLRVPGQRQTVQDVLKDIPDKPGVVLFREQW